MNICVITPYFHPHSGGSQRYIERVYSALKKINNKIKIDIICYNTENTKTREKYKNFNVYRIPCFELISGRFALPNYLYLISFFRKLKKSGKTYDIINSHTRFFDNSWWALLVARYFNAKSVLTDHTSGIPYHQSFFIKKILSFFDRFIFPLIAKKYDLITVASHTCQEYLKTLGIKKTFVTYSGVDQNFFIKNKKLVNRRIPKIKKIFTQNDIIISFVGRMTYAKGPDLVLKVAQNLINQYKNIYFIFAGTGDLFKSLKKQNVKQCYFLGNLNEKQVKKLLTASNILIHPSRHAEACPLVILEAGACKCAVLATNRGDTKKIITDNKTGMIVNHTVPSIQPALQSLINNPNKRKKMGNALYHKVKTRFVSKLLVNHLYQILKKIDSKKI